MRVLIPYDGSRNAENALLELQNAEFGQDDEFLVVIADVFLTESLEEISRTQRERRLNFESSGSSSYVPSRREIEEDLFLVNKLRHQLSADHPNFSIKIETLPGYSLVSSEILEKAAGWKTDLIILGKHKHEFDVEKNGRKSGLWRIVSNAQCPVRFAFGPNHDSITIKPEDGLIVSNDVAGEPERQAERSVQTVSLTGHFKEAPNKALRRLLVPEPTSKNTSNAVTVAA